MLETRTFPRANVTAVATFESDGKRISARVVNLSEGGLMARTRIGFDKGARVRVLLPVPGTANPLEVAGDVVRSEKTDAGFCVALEWTGLSRSDVSRLRALVESSDAIAWEAAADALPRDLAVRFVPKIRRLAWTIAKRVRMPAHVCIDDLVGAGFVALVEVHGRMPNVDFDELERVASARIRGAMLDELRAADPLSRRMRQRQRRLDRSRTQLADELGRTPTDSELRVRTGLSPKAYAEAVLAGSACTVAVLDPAALPEIPDTGNHGPEFLASRNQDLERMRFALGALPPRLKQILELYYGDELTLREIGNLIGVTEARISQLLSAAVKKLRESCLEETPTVLSAPASGF